MKIIITEEQKKKLFIPRKLSGEGSRWEQWNNMQTIKDGERINQYDIETGKKEGYWEYYNYIGDGNKHKIKTFGVYKDNKKYGIWEEYYDNGQLRTKGLYIDDKKIGSWVWYRKNGIIFFKTFY